MPEFLLISSKIIIYAGIVQGIYSAVVLTHTKLRNPANHYLAALLIVLSFSIFHSVFIIPYFHEFHSASFNLKEPFIFLVVPLIWLYVKKLNVPEFRFNRKLLFHFLPFVLVMVFNLIYVAKHSEISKTELFHSHLFVLNIVTSLAAFIQYIFYLVNIFKLIRNFKTKTLSELSNTEYFDLTWLRIFLITILTVFVLLIFMMVIAIHRLNAGYFNQMVSVVFAFAIYILGYKGLFQQTILPINNTIPETREAPAGKSVSETRVDEQLLNQLFDFMMNEKPYHDSELTLTSLASQIKISRNMLSELINSGTGGNFYDFINKYRVEEVKQLITNLKYKDYTILAIAFEAGFASKSTFNSIFKKFTGLTPSEYRNSITK